MEQARSWWLIVPVLAHVKHVHKYVYNISMIRYGMCTNQANIPN